MKLNKTRFLEKFVLATFPIALFVGCSATDTQLLSNTDKQQQDLVTAPISKSEAESLQTDELAIHASYAQVDDVNNKYAETKEIKPGLLIKASVNNGEHSQLKVDEVPENSVFHFGFNQYALSKEQLEILQQHALFLQKNPELVVELSGFSDSRGSAKNNYELSKKRTQIVAEFFTDNGIPESQISVNAYGESFPVNDEHNWEENRRVELNYIDKDIKDEILLSAK